MTPKVQYVLLFHLISIPFWTLFYHFLYLDAIALQNWQKSPSACRTMRTRLIFLTGRASICWFLFPTRRRRPIPQPSVKVICLPSGSSFHPVFLYSTLRL